MGGIIIRTRGEKRKIHGAQFSSEGPAALLLKLLVLLQAFIVVIGWWPGVGIVVLVVSVPYA
jgi:hypothetical protein